VSEAWFDEEPWEADVAALLSGLPTVEPPQGFIASAVDHRPMFAGRLTGALLCASAAFLVAGLVVGALDQPEVVPSIDSLAAQHSSAALNLFGTASEPGPLFENVDDDLVTPVSLPDEFEPRGMIEADHLRQAVFARRAAAVSIFFEPGEVEWSRLPDEGGLLTIAGVRTWFDEDRKMAVVQVDEAVVTIVGLSAVELGEVLEGLPVSSDGAMRRVRDAAAALVAELGFPGR
jgi:hypothetical protein